MSKKPTAAEIYTGMTGLPTRPLVATCEFPAKAMPGHAHDAYVEWLERIVEHVQGYLDGSDKKVGVYREELQAVFNQWK